MRKICLMILMVAFCISISYADETAPKLGSLNIFAKLGEYDLMLDNAFIGRTPAKIDNYQVGTHYLKVVSGETTVSEKVIEIKQGETTTI